jgi:hypothetical protein
VKSFSRIFLREVAKGVFCLLLFAGIIRSQGWLREDKLNPMQGTHIEFMLQGKFLQAPDNLREKAPLIILRCKPGRYSSGHLHGELLGGILHIDSVAGTLIDRSITQDELFSSKPDPAGYYVEFSLDDGGIQAEHWDNISDYQGLGFGSQVLNKVLWGQASPQKENANPPVRKFVITVQRHGTEKIAMQFDMPDPTEVSELCGCTYFREKKQASGR